VRHAFQALACAQGLTALSPLRHMLTAVCTALPINRPGATASTPSMVTRWAAASLSWSGSWTWTSEQQLLHLAAAGNTNVLEASHNTCEQDAGGSGPKQVHLAAADSSMTEASYLAAPPAGGLSWSGSWTWTSDRNRPPQQLERGQQSMREGSKSAATPAGRLSC
jgi:hypothetical protein